MENWIGKVAIVTGASSGIGAAICKEFVQNGIIVYGLARRVDLIQIQVDKFKEYNGKLIPIYCDITKQESINDAFTKIKDAVGVPHILVNNAGITRHTMILSENNDQDLMDVINTNLVGLLFCTKKFFQLIQNTDESGHIININSIFGHIVSMTGNVPAPNIYPGVKHAVKAITEVIRQELSYLKNKRIKISNLSPGLVKTDIMSVGGNPNASVILETNPTLTTEDIGKAVLVILSTPPNVLISELIIKPMGERL